MNLPEHKAGLFLQHNEHKGYYESAEIWLSKLTNQPDWPSGEAKARAIATDEVWTLQWYPQTPVGFHYIAAPTLDELLEAANDSDGMQNGM